MKKLLIIAISLLLLAGCSNGYAKVSDANSEIFSVGNQSYSKGDIYSIMKSNGGSYYVLSGATNTVLDSVVPVDDEINSEVQTQLQEFKDQTGDMYETYLGMYGYSDEQTFIDEMLLPSIRINKLYTLYADEHLDELITEYTPYKITYLTLTTSEDANAALEEVNAGASMSDVAVNYSSTSDGTEQVITNKTEISADVLTYLKTAQAGDTQVITAADGSFYVVKVISTDANEFADEFKDALLNVEAYGEEVDKYYFNKLGFKMYDRDLYDAMNTDYPGYIK